MPSYGPEPETQGASGQISLAAAVMVLALTIPYMSDGFQQRIAVTLQGTALAPFISMQERFTEGRARAEQIGYLQSELDSLAAIAATQAALIDENRALRELLGMAERAGPRFLAATVLRPGTPGSESMFLVNVGSADGVVEGAPVVSARGLVGRLLEVRQGSAVGMDWTHPDFRASAMLADGSTYGLVENVRGTFREEDRLMLNGTAYHENAPHGSLVVTSGLGGVFPRGIRIGRIDATAEVQGSWRKSYWLRPLVDPGAVTHVLVLTSGGDGDVSELWPPDSAVAPADSVPAPGGRGAPGMRAAPPERTAPVESAPPDPRPGAVGAPPAPAVRVPPPISPPPAESVIVPTDTAIAPTDSAIVPADTAVAPADTTIAPADTTMVPADTAIAPPPDTGSAPADSAGAGPPG